MSGFLKAWGGQSRPLIFLKDEMEMVLELDLKGVSTKSREVGNKSISKEKANYFRDVLEYL